MEQVTGNERQKERGSVKWVRLQWLSLSGDMHTHSVAKCSWFCFVVANQALPNKWNSTEKKLPAKWHYHWTPTLNWNKLLHLSVQCFFLSLSFFHRHSKFCFSCFSFFLLILRLSFHHHCVAATKSQYFIVFIYVFPFFSFLRSVYQSVSLFAAFFTLNFFSFFQLFRSCYWFFSVQWFCGYLSCCCCSKVKQQQKQHLRLDQLIVSLVFYSFFFSSQPDS